MKRPATTKITIYVCKSGGKGFCKVSFTYRGKIKGKKINVPKHWLQTDTQVHVQIAKMVQTPTLLITQPCAAA